jgi:hypothetical protein
MSFNTVQGILAADVANLGTFTVSYPTGTSRGTFFDGVGHKVSVSGQNFSVPEKFTFSFGASSVTITNRTGRTLRQGEPFGVQLERPGFAFPADPNGRVELNRSAYANIIQCNLGSPIAAAAASIAASQDPAGAGNLTLNGTLVSGGVATLDVPRNVTITAAGNESGFTFTVTGKDGYGNTQVETITGPNATTAAGKKAFKTVTSIAVSGNSGAISVGHGDVLGLPVYLSDADFVLFEMQDGSKIATGTFVVGDQTTPSGTTGDVRGTYDPAAACDGTIAFRLFIVTPDQFYMGAAQFTG